MFISFTEKAKNTMTLGAVADTEAVRLYIFAQVARI